MPKHILPLLIIFAVTAMRSPADEPNLSFEPAGAGLYHFDTGPLAGRLKYDGHYQGIYPLVDAASKADLTHPPGVFSFYRVFTTGTRYGNGARDWPATSKVRPDGAVEVHWAASETNPVEMTGVYRWSAADTLDLEITVIPPRDVTAFELFMSSYFTKGFLASVYVKSDEGPRFVPIDRRPDSQGGYVMFPRDEQAKKLIADGRWKIAPSPVDWHIERPLAAPLVLRRDAASGITVVMMTPPGDCFAVSSPWNPATPQAGGYRSLYLSLFGRDLKAGHEARARCRLVIGRDIDDAKAVTLYEAYVGE